MTAEDRAEFVAMMREAMLGAVPVPVAAPEPKPFFVRYWPQITFLVAMLCAGALFYGKMLAHATADHHQSAGGRIASLERELNSLQIQHSNTVQALEVVRKEQYDRTRNVAAVKVLETEVKGVKEDVTEIKATVKELLALTLKQQAGGG